MFRLFCTVFLSLVFVKISVLPLGAYTYFWKTYTPADGLPGRDISTLAVDPGGYLWFGNRAASPDEAWGIGILDRTWEFIPPFTADDGLADHSVSSIVFEHIDEDHFNDPDQGAVWIGTEKGLSVLDRNGVWTSLSADSTPLPGNRITALYCTHDNTKWLSVWSKGLCCIDRDFNWGTYSRSDGLCSNYIISIGEDQNGALWFGSKRNGLSVIDREGIWKQFSRANSGLIHNQVRSIAHEPPHRMWFATPEGVTVFDGQSWTSYTRRNSPLGTYEPTVVSIDQAGNKWIGTAGGGLFKLDSFGMWAHFHTGNSRLPSDSIQALLCDTDGSLWIGTPAGLCCLSTYEHDGRYRLPQGTGADSLPRYFGTGAEQPFSQAMLWLPQSSTADKTITLSLCLPTALGAGQLCFSTAVWGGENFNFSDLDYTLSGSRSGNHTLNITNRFSRARFLTTGSVITKQTRMVIDRARTYSFPPSLPLELKQLVLPGSHLPAAEPRIQRILQTSISSTDRKDMYRTCRKIVYSKRMQQIACVDSSGDAAEHLPSPAKNPFSVLEEARGTARDKARLMCTLARSAGIPARIVMSAGGGVWAQVWIAGLDWVSVETCYPVFDYVRPFRTGIPKILLPEDHAAVYVSGRNDRSARLSWDDPTVRASTLSLNPDDLNRYRSIAEAHLLVTTIISGKNPGEHLLIPVGEDIFALAEERQNRVELAFYDRAGIRLASVPLSFDGLAQTVTVRNTFFWHFIARRIGNAVIIENLAIDTAGGITSGSGGQP